MAELRRSAAVAVALAIVTALGLVPGASASAPAPPGGCANASVSGGVPVGGPLVGGPSAPPRISTLQIAGAQQYLRDVDLTTDISATFSADLDVTLTSPAGTEVTITTDNGGANDNVFSGTRWDDDASQPVTDALLVNGVASAALQPEEAMGAFIGENPNGTWTLAVADDAAPDASALDSWSLAIATFVGPPVTATVSATGGGTGAIPNPGLVNGTATVAGAGTYLLGAKLSTDIPHQASGDLSISLGSPALTTTAISTGNAESFDNVFGNGMGGPDTAWYDAAGDAAADPGGGPVTDAEFADLQAETDLVPEGAMGSFIGENPNGTWNLAITDLFSGGFGGDGGSLAAWNLDVTTIASCATAPANLPPVADPGGPYEVVEGQGLALDGSGSSDPDAGDTLSYTWDLNEDGIYGDATGVSPTLTWAALVALGIDNGPDALEVRLTVLDGTNSTVSAPAALSVVNAPPALAITGPSSALAGQTSSWTFTATDPSPTDQAAGFDLYVDWDGDGAVDQFATGASPFSLPHTYPAAGAKTIRAEAEDRDLDASDEATKAVTVSAAPPGGGGGGGGGGAAATPQVPPAVACAGRITGKRRAERLRGTPGGETILAKGGSDRVRARGGDDCVYGGSGRDRIRGGAGNDRIFVAGGGRDRVSCGPGRDSVKVGRGDRVRGCETVERVRRR